jgi:hypothetical protein
MVGKESQVGFIACVLIVIAWDFSALTYRSGVKSIFA